MQEPAANSKKRLYEKNYIDELILDIATSM